MSEDQPHRILLGVTGGIAAYKSAELVRLLRREGMEVRVVLSESAARFVTPLTFQALSAQPVPTSLWEPDHADGMDHIALARWADRVVVAPASADFLARLAQGRADDLLSCVCLARAVPLLVAPAMNRQMWDNPATARNVAQLRADGVEILGPAEGSQACGETGPGRMLEPAEVCELVAGSFEPRTLQGVSVVVTAGPTFERLDAVRGLTNLSSGRMGYAVARAARDAGAQVTLVSGPTALTPPTGVSVVPVVSAQEMFEAVERLLPGCGMFVGVAAVADYTPLAPQTQKIKKDARILALELAPTPDILANVASRADPPFCVGFAAESERLDEFAEAKRRRKQLPLLAANLAQDAIGAEASELVLFDDEGRHPLPRAPKAVQARLLMRHAARLYRSQRP